jgi:hypothetical protein
MPLILTGTSSTTTLDSSAGLTFSDSSNQSAAASPYVLKNRIINGGMDIWQRGTTGSATAGTQTYVSADRWGAGIFGTTTLAQSTSVPSADFQYSLKVQRASGSTSTNAILTAQVVESKNCYDLSGKTVTLSFWAKAGTNYSGASSNLSVQVYTGTTADQGLNYPYYSWTGAATPGSTSFALTTTWTKYTTTFTVSSNILELAPLFFYFPVGTAGADDSFFITGVQLEIGSTATPFERRLYNQELANCQRYYITVGGDTITQTFTMMQAFSTVGFNGGTVPFPVKMRTTPTFSYSALSDFYVQTSAGGALVPITLVQSGSEASTMCGAIKGTVSSGLTAGNASSFLASSINARLNFSAEL